MDAHTNENNCPDAHDGNVPATVEAPVKRSGAGTEPTPAVPASAALLAAQRRRTTARAQLFQPQPQSQLPRRPSDPPAPASPSLLSTQFQPQPQSQLPRRPSDPPAPVSPSLLSVQFQAQSPLQSPLLLAQPAPVTPPAEDKPMVESPTAHARVASVVAAEETHTLTRSPPVAIQRPPDPPELFTMPRSRMGRMVEEHAHATLEERTRSPPVSIQRPPDPPAMFSPLNPPAAAQPASAAAAAAAAVAPATPDKSNGAPQPLDFGASPCSPPSVFSLLKDTTSPFPVVPPVRGSAHGGSREGDDEDDVEVAITLGLQRAVRLQQDYAKRRQKKVVGGALGSVTGHTGSEGARHLHPGSPDPFSVQRGRNMRKFTLPAEEEQFVLDDPNGDTPPPLAPQRVVHQLSPPTGRVGEDMGGFKLLSSSLSSSATASPGFAQSPPPRSAYSYENPSPLVGSFEESVFAGRMSHVPASRYDGFVAKLGVNSKSKTPVPQRKIAFEAVLYHWGEETPYVGTVPLPAEGVRIPRKGSIQFTVFNPNKVPIKVFLVKYDLSDMPERTKTFVRQKTFVMRDEPNLRYSIHLRIICPKARRYYLHKSVQVIFAHRVPDAVEPVKIVHDMPAPRYFPLR